MASKFGESFRGTAALMQNRQELERKEAERRQKLLEKQSEQANKAITNVLDTASKLSEAFQAGQTTMAPEQYQEQINNLVNVAARTSNLATQAGLPVMSSELLEAQRQKLLATATQRQVAKGEGGAAVAKAEGVSEAAGIPKGRALQAAGLDLTPSQAQGPKTTINDLVVPLLMKVQLGGTKSLSDNEWATMELAARHSSGVDVEINRLVRDALDARNEATPPEDIKKRFEGDKTVPKGSKLGMKTEKGYEVLDAKGNLVGYYK